MSAGQAERSFRDDVALDLVGAGPNRAGLVIEPRPLPRAVAGIVARAPPKRLRGPDDRHRDVVQPFAHLAPPQLVDAADRPRFFALRGARDRAPVVQLKDANLDECLREARTEPRVVERAPRQG